MMVACSVAPGEAVGVHAGRERLRSRRALICTEGLTGALQRGVRGHDLRPSPLTWRSACRPLGRPPRVARLAYTRAHAAEALGVSRTTVARRVLPLVETVEMPLVSPPHPRRRARAPARQTAPTCSRTMPSTRAGETRSCVPRDHESHSRRARRGSDPAEIARRLNADGVPRAHGGAQWVGRGDRTVKVSIDGNRSISATVRSKASHSR